MLGKTNEREREREINEEILECEWNSVCNDFLPADTKGEGCELWQTFRKISKANWIEEWGREKGRERVRDKDWWMIKGGVEG